MNTDDFVFAWEDEAESPEPLRVARFEGEEGMSRLFRYEIHLLAKEADLDPEAMIGKRASLWIATASVPAWKVVHGVVTEAEDLTTVPEGSVYRVVLEPPLARARYRTRSRIFLDKTLRQIIESVLRDDAGMTLASGASLEPPVGPPSFTAASERFTFRIKSSRLDDPKARPYVVQYNESDLDFVARLLEEEGISYHFEHTDDASLLVLSDKDFGRSRVPGDDVFGPGKPGRAIGMFRLGARLRETKVHLGAYNWEKPALDVDALSGASEDLSVYAFHGGSFESAELGAPLAEARLDELHTEASFAVGEGVTRVLSAGSIFTLEHPKARYEGEYLVTRLHAVGHQQGVLATPAGDAPAEPFRVEIECACRGRGSDVAESRYRPARRTRKPRILGSQTAFVTAEPSARGAEVNLGGPRSIGCVRLRFHWDTEEKRIAKEPSSKWVRVSEPFARGGQGGLWHPRVGCEVIVEFEDGDPDRPFVTGRVYNGKNRPAQTNPTHSTMWSLSTPGGGVRNEISFEDTAGSERIYTNAGKDMVTNVGNERVENVGADALMTVGASNTEEIGGNQTIQIGANDTLTVGGNQTETIGANQIRMIGGSRLVVIGGNEARQTGASHANTVGGALKESVSGDVGETYGATRTTSIAANWTETYGATRDQTVGAMVLQDYGGNQTTDIAGARTIDSGAVLGALVGGNYDTTIGGSETVDVGAATIHVAAGPITHQASSLDINMLIKLHLVGVKLNMFVFKAAATGKSSSYGALTASAKGTAMSFTGVNLRTVGLKSTAAGAKLDEDGVKLVAIGVLIHPSGVHTFT
ncbi:type VI secretion system tip protein TssI/VgrG [Polyangium sp. y55x31]|uniref:type VI secretion system Vgr family protein n=1 Tax=Polyangium sp. y55x31 TaxID=3042688 RepID=UPI002482236C|nr:type VI secretion system tip protein TssI/VgrG [Polyangium sp. y55x31]MDI1475315.1 type VI secretion system tip protein TssI/VgrG [Polyangium sp. y55x31]